jgi:glycosyltransferase involved in cell wall biosynthesis/ubiquinone/menaquinone biosynthesis C-methylase UbiE
MKLVVFASDALETYYNKGEIKENYFNPNNYFNEVDFISLNDTEIQEDKVQQLVGNAKIYIHPVGKWRPGPRFKKKILRLVRGINPAVIRAYDPLAPGYLAVYCGKKLNIPSVISLHADFDEEREYNRQFGYKRYLKFKIYSKLFERYSLTNGDKIICVTEFLKGYAKKYGAKEENIEVIYNRVDGDRFKRGNRLNPEIVRIICVGRQNKQKNQQCLIRAIKGLKKVELLLIGNGEEHENLKKLAKDLQLEDKVKFIQSVPHSEIHKYYADSDIFAIATDHEGMCIPAAEAMTASLPIVCSNIQPLIEVIDNGGVLVERTPEAFRKAFQDLIEHEELRLQLGLNGKLRAMDFDRLVIELKEAKMYDKLINEISDQITTLMGDTRYLHAARMEYFTEKIKEIKKELNRPLIVLDIGCGDGTVTKFISNSINDEDTLFGLDSDQLRLKRLMSKMKISVILGNATNIPFKDKFADIITLHHVLEHIPEDIKVLQEMKRVLKDDGYIIIGVPNEGDWDGKILRFVHRRMYNPKENLEKGWHVNFYSRKNLSKKLKAEGLVAQEIKGVGFIFPFYPIHYFILKRRRLFKIGNWISQWIKGTADSLFFIIRKDKNGNT